MKNDDISIIYYNYLSLSFDRLADLKHNIELSQWFQNLGEEEEEELCLLAG